MLFLLPLFVMGIRHKQRMDIGIVIFFRIIKIPANLVSKLFRNLICTGVVIFIDIVIDLPLSTFQLVSAERKVISVFSFSRQSLWVSINSRGRSGITPVICHHK